MDQTVKWIKFQVRKVIRLSVLYCTVYIWSDQVNGVYSPSLWPDRFRFQSHVPCTMYISCCGERRQVKLGLPLQNECASSSSSSSSSSLPLCFSCTCRAGVLFFLLQLSEKMATWEKGGQMWTNEGTNEMAKCGPLTKSQFRKDVRQLDLVNRRRRRRKTHVQKWFLWHSERSFEIGGRRRRKNRDEKKMLL